MNRLLNEPAILSALIRQGIALAAAFGLNLNAQQTFALSAFIETVTTLFTRQSVTPNRLAEHRVSMGGRPTVPLDDAGDDNAPR